MKNSCDCKIKIWFYILAQLNNYAEIHLQYFVVVPKKFGSCCGYGQTTALYVAICVSLLRLVKVLFGAVLKNCFRDES